MEPPVPASRVFIHGDEWKLEDIRDEIAWCRSKEGWELRRWENRPALVDKYHTSPYRGQELRTASQRIEPGGWTHDHCRICWWALSEGDDPASNQGYTYNGNSWVCVECFEQFVAPKDTRA